MHRGYQGVKTGTSAYAWSGVYPDQGVLRSKGRPSDFGMWQPTKTHSRSSRRSSRNSKKQAGIAHSVAVRTTERALCRRRWR